MKATDQQFEIFLGKLLRVGVVIAAIIVLAGGVAFLARPTQPRADYRVFHGEGPAMTSVGGVVRGALGMEPLAVIQFGLLVLIATPVARVLFSMLGFALEKDWMYVGVTAVVLVILVYSLMSRSTQ
jgi:uncharacterized membrane protein